MQRQIGVFLHGFKTTVKPKPGGLAYAKGPHARCDKNFLVCF